jgi:hypothetical protein
MGAFVPIVPRGRQDEVIPHPFGFESGPSFIICGFSKPYELFKPIHEFPVFL